MQEEESPIICVSSLVICCNPNVEVIPSILELSYVVLSPLNQRFEIVLKSPRTVKKGLWAVAVSIFNSKLSWSSCDWLGERIKIQIYIIHVLFLSQDLSALVNIGYLEFLRI